MNLNYDLARLEQKYVNELNKQRDELLNQIPSKMRLELDVVNEKVGLNDANRVETLLGALNKPRKLKLKLNKIKLKEIWMEKVISKEFRFGRMFTASSLAKYKKILGLEDYILFGSSELNCSIVIAADENSNLDSCNMLLSNDLANILYSFNNLIEDNLFHG